MNDARDLDTVAPPTLLNLFFDAGVAVTGGRLRRAMGAYKRLTQFERDRVRICIVPYSFDTHRYGRAKHRYGRAVKLGSGGQHKGQKPFLIYMDWSEDKV